MHADRELTETRTQDVVYALTCENCWIKKAEKIWTICGPFSRKELLLVLTTTKIQDGYILNQLLLRCLLVKALLTETTALTNSSILRYVVDSITVASNNRLVDGCSLKQAPWTMIRE